MELRLEYAGYTLGNFLEEDLSGAYLGLSPSARLHLDRFRSFLHSFYVAQHGYWPPTRTNRSSVAFSKLIYRSMYFEFRNLYEYLVDPTSSIDLTSTRPADGGICVYQNVSAFDKRRKYASLPHPLPLIPEVTVPGKERPNTVRKLFKLSQAQKNERRAASLAALSAATNPSDIKIMECSLVREYLRFEKTWTLHEKDNSISCSDARKVRWILIYAILQTLISVTRAPPEVRDTEGVSYSLCCQIAGTPPWDEDGSKAAQKKLLAKRKLIALGEQEMQKVKAEQRQQSQLQEIQNETERVVHHFQDHQRQLAFTTNVIELKPDDSSLFVPKPVPLFSQPSTHRPARPRTLTLPRKVSVGRDLALRSPKPQKPGLIENLIHNYSREHIRTASNSNSSSSAGGSPSSSKCPSGNSSPGGASVSSKGSGRRGNASPVFSEEPSTPGEGPRSVWSDAGGSEIDVMEHASVCGSASSCYGDDCCGPAALGSGESECVTIGIEGEELLDGVRRWESVKSASVSVGELGRRNPEVDLYVWG